MSGSADGQQGRAPSVRFGRFTVDFGARTITADGVPVAVEPQVFDVLECLVTNRDRVVSKLELFDSVWGDRFVSPATLTSRIRDLRSALGDSGREQHTIKTAHGRGFRFVAPVDEQAPTAASSGPAPPDPHLGLKPLLGRAEELADLKDRLGRERLVTLVGPGGAGKTHLMRHATAATDATICELAEVRDGAALARAVLAAVGGTERPDVDTTAALSELLAARDGLIVFDNCEHVIEEAIDLVGRLLRDCRAIRVLATSRRPLLLGDEYVIRVGPLDDAAAATLLVGHAARHGVTLDPANQNVARVCDRLDRLPLALELAASKTRSLPFDSIADLLASHFSLLTADTADIADHHRSLEAAIAWSVDLVTESQQALLSRLSVLAGPFDLETAIAVGTPEAETSADTVADLVALTDISLVSLDAESGHYVLLESIRMFAEQHGLDDATRRRHLDHFLSLAESTKDVSPERFTAQLARLGRAWPNLRTAWAFAEATDDHAAMHRLIAAVAYYAEQTYSFEVIDWCHAAIGLDADAGRATPPETHLVATMLHTHRTDHDDAADHLELGRTSADESFRALVELWWHYSMGDIAAADAAAEIIREREGGSGSYIEIVMSLAAHFLDKGAQRDFDPRDLARIDGLRAESDGDEAIAAGVALCETLRLDWDEHADLAIEQTTATIDTARRLGLGLLASGASTARSIVFALSPGSESSARGLRAALRSYAETGGWWFALADFGGTALTLARQGHAAVAAELLGTRIAHNFVGDVSGEVAAMAAEEARTQLGDDAFDAAIARGGARDTETATAMAIAALTAVIGD